MNKACFAVSLAVLALALAAFGQGYPGTTLTKDIVYGQSGGVDLKLDMAKPDSADGPLPALVFIHGGGWQMGDKSGFEAVIQQYASFGYVTVSVGYRLAPKYPWPAQIEDVKCAVRFLRSHAAEYGINPDKIGAAGHSAGGHLALLLGLMDPGDGFEGDGGNPGVSSSVQMVVNLSGPSDLRAWRALPEANAASKAASGKDFEEVLADFLGTAERTAPIVAQASPVTYIDAEDPPVITFHGSKDPVVPIEQATLLDEALEKGGVKNHKLVILEDADHGLGNPLDLLRIVQESRQFADTWLKGVAPAAALAPAQ